MQVHVQAHPVLLTRDQCRRQPRSRLPLASARHCQTRQGHRHPRTSSLPLPLLRHTAPPAAPRCSRRPARLGLQHAARVRQVRLSWPARREVEAIASRLLQVPGRQLWRPQPRSPASQQRLPQLRPMPGRPLYRRWTGRSRCCSKLGDSAAVDGRAHWTTAMAYQPRNLFRRLMPQRRPRWLDRRRSQATRHRRQQGGAALAAVIITMAVVAVVVVL